MCKFLNVIKAIINALMTLVIILGLAFIILYLFRIVPFVVETGSMQPAIQTGSISFINKNTKYSSIKENDIIAFTLPNGTRATHRVVKITSEGFITKGDSNKDRDGIITTEDNFIGKNIFSIPRLGFFIKLIQTTRGKIISITIIAVIFLSGILMEDDKKKKVKEDKQEDKNEESKDN